MFWFFLPLCHGNCKISQSVGFTSLNFATVLQLPLSFYDSKVGEKAMHVFFKSHLTTDMALITEPKLAHTLVHIPGNYPFSVTIAILFWLTDTGKQEYIRKYHDVSILFD